MFARFRTVCAVAYFSAGTLGLHSHFAHGSPGRTDVIVNTIAEHPITGRLVALSIRDGLVIQTTSEEPERVPTRDLVRIITPSLSPVTNTHDTTVTLAGGDWVHGRIADGTDDGIVLETADLGRLPISLDSIEKIDFAPAKTEAYRETVELLDRTAQGERDRVLLSNGDIIRGYVSAVDAGHITMDGLLGETTIPRSRVIALRLVAAPAPDIADPHMILSLHATGRVKAGELEWSQDEVEIVLLHGQRTRVDPSHIARIDVCGGRWEWLAEQSPISFQHTPMLALDWSHVPNRNIVGGPITVDGETFDHGIGVHSRSTLTYDLKGVYQEFVTSFGIDDNTGPYADVSVHVLVDGKTRFTQEHVRRGKLFGPLRLNVAKAKRIELVVDFGDNGDIQDRFNWVEAALIR